MEMSEEIFVSPTSNVTADCKSIILRETKTTRLIFRPMLVDNPNEEDACVRGWLVFERKKKDSDWEEHKKLLLSNLRAEEWIKIELHSSELLLLYRKLGALYELYSEHGIPSDETLFIEIDLSLGGIIEADEKVLNQFLFENEIVGLNALTRLLKWASSLDDLAQVVNGLEQVKSQNLQRLSSLVDITLFRNCVEVWKLNGENSDEEYWQNILSEYSFILSQIFAHPVVIVKDKAYVGGKGMANIGGNLVDFLAQNDVSKNAVLIEIKTPRTRLLGSKYRSVYSISPELSGTIVQVSNYKRNLEHEFSSLRSRSELDIESFEPLCVIVAGNYAELNNPVKKKAFELFRSRLQGKK